MRMFTKIFILLAVMLVFLTVTGCATIDYCSLSPLARCDLEQRLEAGINNQLDVIGTAALFDVHVQCPDAASCEPVSDPAPGDEAGDWRQFIVIVPGR